MQPQRLAAALRQLGGTSRLLVYDVPEDEAPSRAVPSTPFVRGGKAWWRFIERRRALDNGRDLNLMVSLRGLNLEERLLAVNWGTAFANAFLLVEPFDPWLDLTTPDGIDDFCRRSHASDPDGIVRRAYADWVYWTRDDEGELESHSSSLDVSNAEATIWGAVWERLPRTFSSADFLSCLTLLNLRETELFSGGREVHRAVIPFLTRLGLPVLYDAGLVLQAMRQLINAGLASARDTEDGAFYNGPLAPLPADVSDERLAMMMLR
jgi:hypothetical protein